MDPVHFHTDTDLQGGIGDTGFEWGNSGYGFAWGNSGYGFFLDLSDLKSEVYFIILLLTFKKKKIF